VLNCDPNSPEFQLPDLDRLEDVSPHDRRRVSGLLRDLDKPGRAGGGEDVRDAEVQRSRAMAMLATDDTRRAFDLSQEPPALRERYGRNPWGQSHLLARRLVQQGVRFVTTVNGPGIRWDTHQLNFEKLTPLIPPMQQAFCALLDDLTERGMLESTLVLWMGDFGRTPKINTYGGRGPLARLLLRSHGRGGIRAVS